MKMAAPKADPPKCDLAGCGMLATRYTDGTEEDVQGLKRPAVKNLNVCDHHSNWPHSDDAKIFAASNDGYRGRK